MIDFFILLYFLALGPKLGLDWILRGKKHPGVLQRLGFSLPSTQGKQVFWVHAVSVGEVKSVQPLFIELRKLYPDSFFLVTTTSATGQEEAKRSLLNADAFAYFPIDLSWIVKKWVKKLQPRLFILVEGDFWPQLIAAVKKQGGRIALVSGKVSERSARRFLRFPFFSKRIFPLIDLYCLQNEEYYRRFIPLAPDPSRLFITGNLKLDIKPQPINISFWKKKLSLPDVPILTISCTHAPEEEWILDALDQPDRFFFLVPRHPERFEQVAQLLTQANLSFSRWSQLDQRKTSDRVILVDAMGQLPICYSLSRLAILGGSFIDRVGGHNVIEPCLYGTPVFFGPHMFKQSEFASRAIQSNCGQQIPIDQLSAAVDRFFKDPVQEGEMRKAASSLQLDCGNSTAETLQQLKTILPPL